MNDVATYCTNLKDSIDKIEKEKPSLVVLTGDFNARSPLEVQIETNSLINSAKEAYIKNLSDKLCNPKSSSNVFWSAFKRLLNNKKLTNIPPLLESGSFVTNISDKAAIFNTYFSSICRPLENGSTLPDFSFCTLLYLVLIFRLVLLRKLYLG